MTFPLTLSVDTATARGIVVLARGSAILASSTYDAGSDHAEKLLDHVQIVLDRASLTLADVATFGVGVGPGSFTGVRVGVTTIKGFGLVFPRPVIPVSSLALLVDATAIPPSGLVALATAGREDSFVGVFQSAADLLVPNAGDVEVVPHATLPAWCEARGLVAGVGADFARLLPLLADRTVSDGLPTPEALANLVSQSAPLPPSAVVDLEPAYARPPQITLSRAQRAIILRSLRPILTPRPLSRYTSPSMDDLSPSDRAKLLASHGRPFAAGDVLFREGDPAREALLLQEGKVRLLKVVRAQERTLLVVRPGDLFGEGALLPGSTRSSTAIALTDGVALALDPATFTTLLQSTPAITPRVLGQLVRRLRDAEDQVEIMMLRDTQSKVVAALLKAAERALAGGSLRADGAIVVALSPMELSTRVGLAVDAVKTCVQRLREGQYVRVVDEQLEVLDVDALRKLYGLLGVKDQLRSEGPTADDPSVRARG